MRKLDEIRRADSCFSKAAPEEPLFVLRGNDELASEIVYEWAIRYAQTKGKQPGGITPQQTAKYHEAMRISAEMREWKRKNG